MRACSSSPASHAPCGGRCPLSCDSARTWTSGEARSARSAGRTSTSPITIARAATQPFGWDVFFKAPKTESGLRTITMLEPTAAMLRDQKRRVAEWCLANA